ncbi:MAG: type II toxin-antitoxin system RelE/ParE family toxin [Sulfurimonas sp.]|uniref:type II toxin-antitoxin system RelE/ParE family toxin n=1 Tax=Sulfurimonas sp. TaxID=2022749 RepID=UPI003D14CCD0
MQITKDDIFTKNLKNILKFIVFHKLNNIPNMPYKYRKSNYYEDADIRDFIFKGYTIPYLIDLQNNTIVLLDIFKWTLRDIS